MDIILLNKGDFFCAGDLIARCVFVYTKQILPKTPKRF